MSGVMMPPKKQGGIGQIGGALSTAKDAYGLYQGFSSGGGQDQGSVNVTNTQTIGQDMPEETPQNAQQRRMRQIERGYA